MYLGVREDCSQLLQRMNAMIQCVVGLVHPRGSLELMCVGSSMVVTHNLKSCSAFQTL
jgi:hypothetical protein